MASVQSVTAPTNSILTAIAGTTSYTSGSELTYYFGTASDTFYGDDPITGSFSGTQVDFGWQEEALRAYTAASVVADISFSEVSTQTDADLSLFGAEGLTYGSATLSGYHYFPGKYENDDGETVGYGVMAMTSAKMIIEPEQDGDGNYRSMVLLHEIGHGLGLGHADDSGNGTTSDLSGSDLHEERYTVMASKGYFSSNSSEYGHAVSYMALDIAALQHMYGEDTTANTTSTTYTLTDAGAAELDLDGSDGSVSIGRAYYCIWDAGDTDTISYGGSDQVLINLNDATLMDGLDSSEQDLQDLLSEIDSTGVLDSLDADVVDAITNETKTAGGFFSQIINSDGTAVTGGFSIANGVVIENAEGGSGDDILIGNEADNVLTGHRGDDVIFGGAGEDTLFGQKGDDTLYGGDDRDHLYGAKGDDTLYGGDGNDMLKGADGSDYLYGEDGDDTLISSNDGLSDYFEGGDGTDSFVFLENISSNVAASFGFGDDTIADFEDGTELVDMTAIEGIEFGLSVTNSGSDAIADFGDYGSITFTGMAGLIDENDFVFAEIHVET